MSNVAAEREFVHAEDIRCGLKTDHHMDRLPPYLGVAWIEWDSGFRNSGLRIGDRILAVDGTPLPHPSDQREYQRLLPRMIGQHAESQEWVAQGKQDGTAVRLRIRRRVSPGEGWTELDVTGTLRADRSWSNASQRPIFGPGGPERLGRDGFDDAWSSWYEKCVFDWERILDGGWQRGLQTRMALASHLEHKSRVDALVEKFPGPFAAAVYSDWQLVKTCVEGDFVALPPDALAFRTFSEEQARRISVLAAAAWTAAQAARSEELLSSFPAIDPFRGDRSSVNGKLVVLPAISPRDWLVDMGKPYLAWNDANYWVFASCESPAMRRIFDAVRRYEKIISPGVRQNLALIGRLLPNPRLLAGSGRTVAGLEVEPVVALVGDMVCVDATVVIEGRSPFIGEDTVPGRAGRSLKPDAPPREVMEAMIAAIKRADQETWAALFAEWRAVPDEDRPIWYPFYAWNGRDEEWVRSRRLLLDSVLDARVRWVDEPRVIIRGDSGSGLPLIEEVAVEIDHIGLFDGETRVFNSINVHRAWTLQRRDGRPWLIASRQSL